MKKTNLLKQKYLGHNLIFIISQPRSGSTLLQRILYGHPKIQTSAETWLMLHPCYAFKSKRISTDYDANFSAIGTKEFIENYTDGFEVYDDAIRQWAYVIYNNVIEKHNREYFLDKTPRYFFIIEDLYRLFPEAKFIFLLRNPMAILASELKTYVKGEWQVLGVFRPDLMEAPDLIMKGIRTLGDAAYVIRYENLVTAPELEVKNLCNYLQLPFYEEMIEYRHTPAPKGIMNDQTGIHRHKKPSNSSVEKWKLLANDAQNNHFMLSYLQSLGESLIENMGYNYEEIRDHLLKVKKAKQDLIYPWSLAIRPSGEWTIMDHYRSNRYFYIKANGRARGTIKAVGRGMLEILAAMKGQIRSKKMA